MHPGTGLGDQGLLTRKRCCVFDIVIGQAGDPDRSMLFWGIPILLSGLAAGIAAIGLAIVGSGCHVGQAGALGLFGPPIL